VVVNVHVCEDNKVLVGLLDFCPTLGRLDELLLLLVCCVECELHGGCLFVSEACKEVTFLLGHCHFGWRYRMLAGMQLVFRLIVASDPELLLGCF